jgi:predicted nuclease of predicted toxin-antitoxin system
MLRLLSDENFNGDIVRGLLHHRPNLDLRRVQDVGLETADDPTILEWAAANNCILLTHDHATMPNFPHSRVVAGQPMPGVFVVNDRLAVRQTFEELLLIEDCSEPAEWSGSVIYLPLYTHHTPILTTPHWHTNLRAQAPVTACSESRVDESYVV